jgi:hypothetical protein
MNTKFVTTNKNLSVLCKVYYAKCISVCILHKLSNALINNMLRKIDTFVLCILHNQSVGRIL